MHTTRSVSLLIGVVFFLSAAALFAAGPFDGSIVRVSVTKRDPNVLQPWTKASPTEVSGTGFVIEGRRLLTNAHVVEYASQIYVQPNRSSEQFDAKVEVSAPEADLAVLSVADEAFFANRSAIPMLVELPKIKSSVNVYGYPVGGDQISVTEGIVSRLDFTRFQRGTQGLRIQIDAALNRGNSGGPAISDGKVVGVAFQMLQQAENVGYLISVEDVKMFLDDIRDGKYDGKPVIVGDMQTVENDALRAWLGLAKGVGGAMVTRLPRLDVDYVLQVGDVITHIGDHVLDQAAKVKVTEDLTLPFGYFAPKVAQGGRIPLKVLRGGKPVAIEIPALSGVPQLIPNLRGTYPRYFILGPLVFSSATRELLSGVGSRTGGVLMARANPLFTRLTEEPAFAGEELVVISSPMFSHRITKGYSQPFGSVVKMINGKPVKNLKHLVELLRDDKNEYLEIDFADSMSEKLVFRRKEIDAATEEVLSDNGIRKQYSDDLAAIWEGRQAKN